MNARFTALHTLADPERSWLKVAVTRFIEDRSSSDRVGGTASQSELSALLQNTVGPQGLGVEAAWEVFESVVAANTFALDGPRFLAFIPMAPSTAAIWMDAAVGAASFSAESWLEAAGAVAAENKALDVIKNWAGMPAQSGGAFCSGGSVGNLSALAVARDRRPDRRSCVVADTAHASIGRAAHLLGLHLVVVPTGPDGRLTAPLVRRVLDQVGTNTVGSIVASAGSTNAGVVDDLASLAELAEDIDAWFHVDAAYGGAALAREDCRPMFAGIERADSVIVDPHKWLFATGGACAVLYREPALAIPTHRQSGPYIDSLHDETGDVPWNPSDYAFQLTRRASGLPFWFTLAVHGEDAMASAVGACLEVTRHAARAIDALADADVINDPQLGVVLFRRTGWDAPRWRRWARELARGGIAFVAPTTHRDEVVGRLVFMNPRTTTEIADEVVATLR